MAGFMSYCVAPMKQLHLINSVYKNDDEHSAHKGICFGLCLEWIDRHRFNKGEIPKKRIEHLSKEDTIINAAIKQDIYRINLRTYLDTGSEQIKIKNKSMNYVGQKIVSSSTKMTNYKSKNISKDARKFVINKISKVNSYNLISFDFLGLNAGHTTCGYFSGGTLLGIGDTLQFFDPNYGEFSASSWSLHSFFSALTDQYRSYINRYDEKMDLKISNFVVQTVGFD